jgi:hypothetical protein
MKMLNNVVKVTNGLGVLMAILYVVIRILEDNDSRDGGYINNYPWLN